jgi:membrane protease YdiL (CAAX protease family)
LEFDVSDPAVEVVQLIYSAITVTSVVGLLSFLSWSLLRWRKRSIIPRWSLPSFVWPGPWIFAFFFLSLFGLPILIQLLDESGILNKLLDGLLPRQDSVSAQVLRHVKSTWVSFAFVPSVLFCAVLLRFGWFAAPIRWLKEVELLPRAVVLGSVVFATFGLASFIMNGLLNYFFQQFGWSMTEHPLSKMGLTGDGVGGCVFVLGACLIAPILEEFLFRGLLISWTSGRWYRPWILVAFAAYLSAQGFDQKYNLPGLTFVVALAVVLFGIQRFAKRWKARFPVRTASSIWASSILFAAAHSSVWPTPIPLFVLALGFGYLTARTRSWIPSAFAHAAFNAVSTIFVALRSHASTCW